MNLEPGIENAPVAAAYSELYVLNLSFCSQRPERLPVVLTIEAVRRVIGVLTDPAQLVVKLLYGSGCDSSKR